MSRHLRPQSPGRRTYRLGRSSELDYQIGVSPPGRWRMLQDAEQLDKPTRIWEAEPLAEKATAAPGTILRADKNGIDVACGEGVLRLKQLQLSGSKSMKVLDLLNSRREMFAPGVVLG